MLDLVRTSLHRAITSPVGDGLFPVRVPKDLARRMNALLGEPLCSKAELERRRAGRARLEALKSTGGAAPAATSAKEQAPVMVYFDKDKRQTARLDQLKDALDTKRIAYTVLDVAGDEAMINFVVREARCKDEDLPVVFIGGKAVGGYDALVEWEASGKLAKALAGG